jgi:hypothetical protein
MGDIHPYRNEMRYKGSLIKSWNLIEYFQAEGVIDIWLKRKY